MIMAGLADKVTGWTGDMAALPSVAITADNLLGLVMVFKGFAADHTVLCLPLRACSIIGWFWGGCGFVFEDFLPKA